MGANKRVRSGWTDTKADLSLRCVKIVLRPFIGTPKPTKNVNTHLTVKWLLKAMHLGIMIDDALSSPLDRNARMIGYYIFVHSYLSIKELICLCQTNAQKYNYQMQNF